MNREPPPPTPAGWAQPMRAPAGRAAGKLRRSAERHSRLGIASRAHQSSRSRRVAPAAAAAARAHGACAACHARERTGEPLLRIMRRPAAGGGESSAAGALLSS